MSNKEQAMVKEAVIKLKTNKDILDCKWRSMAFNELSYAAYKASMTTKEKHPKKNDKRSRNGGRRNDWKASNKEPKIERSFCHKLGHAENQCWNIYPELKPNKSSAKSKNKDASNSVNAMEAFEFSNVGVKRGYSEPEPSDTSVNTQFEAME